MKILVTPSNYFLTKLVVPTIITSPPRPSNRIGGTDDLPHANRRVPRLQSPNTPDLQPPLRQAAAERQGPGNGHRRDPILDRHSGRGATGPTRTIHTTALPSPRSYSGRA